MKRILQSLWIFILSMSVYAQTPIHQFNFDGTVTNTANTVTLTTNAISYGNDRNGQANKALYMGLSGSQAWANISNIPLGNASRTISMWFKASNTSATNIPLFTYGTDTNNNAINAFLFYDQTITAPNGRYFGVNFGGLTNTVGFSPELPFSGFAWHHYAISYNGTTVKVYLDGGLVASAANNTINTTGTQFNVGNYISTNALSVGWYDDLQIYNTALTDAQINQLYTNNALIPVTAPTISSVSSSNVSSNSALINCNFFTNGATTTTTLYYGTSSTALNLLAGSSGTTNHSTTMSNRAFSLSGLQPSTTYYYKVNASNSAGNVDSSVLSFVTSANPGGSSITDGLIAYYGFEGNFNSHNNLHNLTAAPNDPFISQNGVVGSCINVESTLNEGLVNTASLNTALVGNEFTICYWVKQLTNFTSGTYPTHFEMFGSGFVRHDNGTLPIDVGYGTSATSFKTGFSSASSIAGNWNHIAIVHKAGFQEFELYINGVLYSTYASNTSPIPNLHKFSTNFHIGTGSVASKSFKGDIDEFYIYNRALTSSEILAVRNNTTAPLSTSSFSNNLIFNLYPNPASEMITIEMDSEVKTVEIYSVHGQKVQTSNTKSVVLNNLAAGVYFVKVEDVDGLNSTKKLIIK
mgnify:CR=1 FL=1|jgi:hypothetical protein